ncbi:MAG: radical SAM protein [Chloroflexota bacterium]|nr:radical SAM protein [Chloroflexota bacterium]
MIISGLHLLLTYQCNFECDHCFVWGSPRQRGTMTLAHIREILRQADALGTVESIYFEGGEPFLYYPILLAGVEEAAGRGFQTGVVTNGYWATEVEDALAWLRPLAALIRDLSVSSDLYHYDEQISRQAQNARHAAERLDIPVGTISVAQPDEEDALASLMVRGRAVDRLASRVPHHPWTSFTECPHEDLRDPGRVHVDPLGHVHLCQGLSLGNLFRTPLTDIPAALDPDAHPVIGPLLHGGPAELARRYGLTPQDAYADACHLCYETRLALRERFPEILTPDQMYGVPEG